MNRAAITVEMLLAGVQTADPAEWRRRAARCAWVRETAAAWREAMRAMDERCEEAFERLDEAAFEIFCAGEQAKVDAIRAQLVAVAEEDRWPRELYIGGI